ncbi:O-methyltransferase 1, chloroplastic [Typha latifolia]|uniref:O-methyltransferase 1, chloroplastic n=1 Tax=Typha latifolia TaxID=4733 RepID=UPI003C2BA166
MKKRRIRRRTSKKMAAAAERLISPLIGFGEAANRAFRGSPFPAIEFSWRRRLTRSTAIAARVGSEESDPLLRSALMAASLRYQESLRPDPLFIDPYAGCFLSPDAIDNMVETPVSTSASWPCHYNVATKFIDDKLLSLVSRSDELRQIVLLTDGMDTRPYRLSWPRLSIIYDVSPERIFKLADEKLKGMGAKISRNCLLNHIPEESCALHEIWCKTGFNGGRPSVWALQGLPLLTLTSLKDLLLVVSSLAMKGSIFLGELPGLLDGTASGNMAAEKELLERVFITHGFRLSVVDYKEVTRNMHLEPDVPLENSDRKLFVAEQLLLSDAQMESWRSHFGRIEEEGDEEGFEEL